MRSGLIALRPHRVKQRGPRCILRALPRRCRMLWVKAFHIVFVVTWFAGLFYLPRLFIYHAASTEPQVRAQLKVMERRLLVITHIGGALAIVFGVWTLRLVPA